jgi:hypothetical protein
MVERALEMEGTCTGEHGIGIGKKESLVKELGIDTIGVMQKLKSSLDPYWIMNPGKERFFFECESMTYFVCRQNLQPAHFIIAFLDTIKLTQ